MKFTPTWYKQDVADIPSFQELEDITGSAYDEQGVYIGPKEKPDMQLVMDRRTNRQYWAPKEYDEDAIKYSTARMEQNFNSQEWWGMVRDPHLTFGQKISTAYIEGLKQAGKLVANAPTKIVAAATGLTDAVGIDAGNLAKAAFINNPTNLPIYLASSLARKGVKATAEDYLQLLKDIKTPSGQMGPTASLYRASAQNWQSTLDKYLPDVDENIKAHSTLVAIGSMAGQVGGSLLLAAATSHVGGMAAVAAVFGSQQFYDIREEYLSKGYSLDSANIYAGLAAIAEGGLEALGFTKWLKYATLKPSLRNHLIAGFMEASQEALQTTAEETITNLSGVREETLTEILAQIAISAVAGFIPGAGLSVVSSGIGIRQEKAAYELDNAVENTANIVPQKQQTKPQPKEGSVIKGTTPKQELELAKANKGSNQLYEVVKNIADSYGVTDEKVIDGLYYFARNQAVQGKVGEELLEGLGNQLVAYKNQLSATDKKADKENKEAAADIAYHLSQEAADKFHSTNVKAMEESGIEKQKAEVAAAQLDTIYKNLSEKLGIDLQQFKQVIVRALPKRQEGAAKEANGKEATNEINAILRQIRSLEKLGTPEALAQKERLQDELDEKVDQEGKRGYISLGDTINEIVLGRNSDISTLQHEMMHHFRNVINLMAAKGNKEAIALKAQMDKIIEAHKDEVKQGINKEEEVLSEAYEAWLYGGVVSEDPTQQKLFDALKQFFNDVYDSVRAITGIRIDPEIDMFFRQLTGEMPIQMKNFAGEKARFDYAYKKSLEDIEKGEYSGDDSYAYPEGRPLGDIAYYYDIAVQRHRGSKLGLEQELEVRLKKAKTEKTKEKIRKDIKARSARNDRELAAAKKSALEQLEDFKKDWEQAAAEESAGTMYQEGIKYDKNGKADINSPEFKKWFGNSKVVDENGKPLVVYHGTPNATFSEFRTPAYFTTDKKYAEGYQRQGASYLGYKQSASNPDTYAVYLSIKKPFDTRNKKAKDLFYKEYYGQRGVGSDITEKGLPDWMEAEDLTEWLEESHPEYDGLIVDEGGTGGYGQPVLDRGVAYLPFSPTQIKSVYNKGTFDEKNPNIYYQNREQAYRDDRAQRTGAKAADPKPSKERIAKDLQVIRNKGVEKYEPKSKLGRSLGDWGKHILLTVRQRAGAIDPKIKAFFDKLDYFQPNLEKKFASKANGFIKKFQGLTEVEKDEFDYYIYNQCHEELNAFLKEKGMEKEYNEVRQLLNFIYAVSNQAGIDMNFVNEYFPTSMIDYAGFLDYLKGTDKWSYIQKALREADPEGLWSDKEKAEAINKLLRGYRMDPVSKPKNAKERTILYKSPELMKFYEHSDVALIKYLQGMSQAIAINKAFGKGGGFNTDETIGAIVLDLINSGTITNKEEAEIKRLLKSRLSYGATPEFIAMVKNVGYLQTMNNITSAVTQLGDLYAPFYKYSFGTAIKSIFGKAEITKTDLGLDKIWEEFSDSSKTGIAVDKLFKVIGLEKMDSFGKNVAINASLLNLREQAANGNIELTNRLAYTFGKDAGKVLADIKAGKVTEEVKILIWADLADTQPIGRSGVPTGYLDNPHGRLFYQLKTFSLNQISLFYADSLVNIQKGIKYKNKAQFLKGVQNGFKLLLLLTAGNAGADVLKNLIMGRDIDISDTVVSNLLWNIGVSKYTFYKGKRDGYARALLSSYLMPPQLSAADDMLIDVRNIAGGKKQLKDSAAVTYLPYGRAYYWWFGGGSKQGKERTAKMKKKAAAENRKKKKPERKKKK